MLAGRARSEETQVQRPEEKPNGKTDKEWVNHPAHYNVGGIEVMDAISAWKLNFARGAVVKHVARAGHKNPATELEDLKKARWYLQYEIDRLEGGKKDDAT